MAKTYTRLHSFISPTYAKFGKSESAGGGHRVWANAFLLPVLGAVASLVKKGKIATSIKAAEVAAGSFSPRKVAIRPD